MPMIPAAIPHLHGRRRFAEQFNVVCREHPTRTALVCGRQSTTFSQLHRQAAVVAAVLTKLRESYISRYSARDGGRTRTTNRLANVAGNAVSICMCRSFDYVVAVLACLLADLVFVPIEVAFPLERRNQMVLAASSWLVVLPQHTTQSRCAEAARSLSENCRVGHPIFAVTADFIHETTTPSSLSRTAVQQQPASPAYWAINSSGCQFVPQQGNGVHSNSIPTRPIVTSIKATFGGSLSSSGQALTKRLRLGIALSLIHI